MKLTNLLKQILLEKKGDTYKNGCAMLYFKFPQLKEIQDQIDPEDLYTETEGGRSYGIEDEPHTTLLFGFDPDVPLQDVVSVLDEHTFSPCQVYNASLFENKDKSYDVLKFDVRGAELKETNKELAALPHTNEFPEYHPHLTICYVKTGKGKKYVDMFEGKEYELLPTYAVYSSPGRKDKITIKVKNQ